MLKYYITLSRKNVQSRTSAEFDRLSEKNLNLACSETFRTDSRPL